MPINSDGVKALHGGSGRGGDTGLHPSVLYYCGRIMKQCRCGDCDGRCGPISGCPCNSCVELVGFKVNRENDLCQHGKCGFSGGFTSFDAKDLYYCGQIKNECKCGRCDGTCGPNNGCPCTSCLALGDSSEEDISSDESSFKDATDTFEKLSAEPNNVTLGTGSSGGSS